jgi:hypothetical protein
MDATNAAGRLALGQGLYFAAAGMWPVVHLASFEAITGPKREGWLVKTVGAMIAVAGASLMVAGARRAVAPETVVLGAGSAAALAVVDVWYGGVRRRIGAIYLADAVLELGLLAAWGLTRRSRPAPPSRLDAEG